eukprot:134614-Chlamydomonas_euryale.AAC.1
MGGEIEGVGGQAQCVWVRGCMGGEMEEIAGAGATPGGPRTSDGPVVGVCSDRVLSGECGGMA